MAQKVQVSPIDAINPMIGVSKNYSFVDSKDIIKSLTDLGASFQGASFGKVRKAEKNGYQKHIMVFDLPMINPIDDQNKLNLLVTNSHDRSTGIVFNLGIFRSVCANGLVVGNSLFQSRFLHMGKNLNDTVKNSLEMIFDQKDHVYKTVNEMKNREMSQDEKLRLLESMALTRLDQKAIIDLNSFQVRRNEDTKQDLYTIFNVGQEYCVKGGFRYSTFDQNGKVNSPRHATKLRSAIGQVKLNKALWTLTDQILA